MIDVPLRPSDLGLSSPPLSGAIKQKPEDFQVTEVPLYPPSGQGEFLYLQICRAGMNTGDVLADLGRAFHVLPEEVGYAGLKDRQSVSTQWFSIPLNRSSLKGLSPDQDPEDKVNRCLQSCSGLDLLDSSFHTNSLRRGHLKGNRFSILVRNLSWNDSQGASPSAFPAGNEGHASSRIAAELERPGLQREPHRDALQKVLEDISLNIASSGMPNLFGAQRFGQNGSTFEQGLQFMDGRKTRKWMLDLGMSAVQSYVFNHYLRFRHEAGALFRMLDGDLAMKAESGGIFKVPVAAEEQARLQTAEISYTGPMFGKKMRSPEGPALELEERALEFLKRDRQDFVRMKVPGARRAGLVFPENLQWTLDEPQQVRFEFFLPAGSYATVLLGHYLNLEPELE
ncbi:MAG: tRNA pseudouridine(13) synthase TruD [Leptospiraceae bacterium]|nr:tRNA pseudouridine(13) synthase TruD [Leptospiraceae bacterium]